jgi:DNA-binding MarR family transcriptional regulator
MIFKRPSTAVAGTELMMLASSKMKSGEMIGLVTFLLTIPAGTIVTIEKIRKRMCWGRAKMSDVLAQLQKIGFIKRLPVRVGQRGQCEFILSCDVLA